MTTSPFSPTSRYYGIEIASLELPDGSTVSHLRRRFLPAPDGFALLHEHVVVDGERPDTIAHAELGDPQAWWRIADANGVMRVVDLVELGIRLRITLPDGIPAPSTQES